MSKADISLHIKAHDGRDLYTLQCHSAGYEGDSDFDYSGDFECRLILSDGRNTCSILKEVTSKEPVIPPGDSPIKVPNIINTDFFCEADGRKIVALLRNWEGDTKQEEYQQTTLRMAKGIRLSRQEEAR